MERPQNCNLINWVINWDLRFIHFQWMTLKMFSTIILPNFRMLNQTKMSYKMFRILKRPQNCNLVNWVINPLTFAVNDIRTLLLLFGKDCSTHTYTFRHTIQIYSGITRGRVLNGELYTQRLHKVIYLCLSTKCFMKISFYISGQIMDL